MLHGPYGEDGCIQDYLNWLIFHTWDRVLWGLVGMDKVIMKSVFKASDLPQLDYYVTSRSDWHSDKDQVIDSVSSMLNFPVFVNRLIWVRALESPGLPIRLN